MRHLRWLLLGWATCWVMLPSAAAPAGGIAVVTVLEGEATILRGDSKLAAAIGLGVRADDVIETADTTFLRIEFTAGPILDLGGATRLLLDRLETRRNNRPALYLLAGWLKISSPDAKAAPFSGVSSPRLDLGRLAGVVLLEVQPVASSVFIESGASDLTVRSSRPAPPLKLAAGDFVDVGHDGEVARAVRPSAPFLAAVPIPFRDSLPPRLPTLAARPVTARELGRFGYQDVEAWLDADRTLGRHLVQIWAPKAAEPQFRAALIAGLPAHPEWFPVLYPDCCNPPPPPAKP
jgi:hypothetical protein